MKRIYILLALLPISLESKIYGSEINKAIEPELKSARSTLKNQYLHLELDPILESLLAYGAQPERMKQDLAYNHMQQIKKALEKYKKQQYSSFWSTWFGSTPKIVSEQINPAINKVTTAMKSFKDLSKNTAYVLAGIAAGLGSLALVGTALAYVHYNDNEHYNDTEPFIKSLTYDKFKEDLKDLGRNNPYEEYSNDQLRYLYNIFNINYNDRLRYLYNIFNINYNVEDKNQHHNEIENQYDILSKKYPDKRDILDKAKGAIISDYFIDGVFS